MRATTRFTPNVSRATRAIKMLELSPLVTAATAQFGVMPASVNTSRSNPTPTIVVPLKSSPRRRNDSSRRSITITSCSEPARFKATSDPTRPHPTTMTCIRRLLLLFRAVAHRMYRNGDNRSVRTIEKFGLQGKGAAVVQPLRAHRRDERGDDHRDDVVAVLLVELVDEAQDRPRQFPVRGVDGVQLDRHLELLPLVLDGLAFLVVAGHGDG